MSLVNWGIRIVLTSDKIPADIGYAEPWHFTPGELELLVHSGEGRIYPLGISNPESSLWYPGYLPKGSDFEIDSSIDLNAGGDLEKLRGVKVQIANQMATGEIMTQWMASTYDGLTMAGATIQIFREAPKLSAPTPTPRWTGIVRTAQPVGTSIELVCEPTTMSEAIGDDVGGGMISPIVYGTPKKLRLPQIIKSELPISPMDGNNTPSDPILVYGIPVVGITSDEKFIDLACNIPSWVRYYIPVGPVTSSDWFVEIISGAGKGLCRRITKGAELVHSTELPGYPGHTIPSGYPMNWWRVPIDEPFIDPDTRASLIDIDPVVGIYANKNRSVVRITRRSLEFAVPSHLTPSDVIEGATITYTKVGEEYIRAENFDKIWEPGETAVSLRAIPSPSKVDAWTIYQHLVPTDGQFEIDLTGDAATSPPRTQQELLDKFTDKTADLVAFTATAGSVRFRVGASSIPFGLGLLRIWGVVYVLTADTVWQIEMTTYGEYTYDPLQRTFQNVSGNQDTAPPWFGPWPGRTDWRKATIRLYDFGGHEAAIEFVELAVGALNPSFSIGQMGLIAELECSIGNVYVDTEGARYNGSGDSRLEGIWATRLTEADLSGVVVATDLIQDHVHILEDIVYRHFGGDSSNVDVSSIRQAYLDLVTKTQTSLTAAPVVNRPKAVLATTKVYQAGDVLSQVCRDGMLAGGFDGQHRLVLKAWLARTGLAEADATITEADVLRGSFSGFEPTPFASVVTAPIIRYAVEDGVATQVLQILRPDADTYDPSYAIGFLDADDAERAWEICHAAWLKSKLVHVREMTFDTVNDYQSLIFLVLQQRGTTFLQWIAETKDTTIGLVIEADHPAAELARGSRVLLTDAIYCPGGRYGTLVSNPTKLGSKLCPLTLMMDIPA